MEQTETNKFALPVAIVIAGGLIAGALYFSNIKLAKQAQPQPVQPTNTDSASNMKPISACDHILGNPEANIIVVEYSDTECPYCKTFQATMKRVISEYGKSGKVAWVYRHFPIASRHPKAPHEAEATECANELGGPTKFWQYLDALYEKTPSNNGLDPAELPKIASAVGLDVKAFNTCLSSGKYTAMVQASYEDALKAGGRGTPNSILVSKDGTKTTVEGAYPYEQFKEILDAALSK